MSEIPSILVTNGWKTDRNRKLTEVVIPSTVKTLNAPTKVTFMGTTLNVVPSSKTALQEIEAPNITSIYSTNFFNGYTGLLTVSFNSVVSLGNISTANNGTFYGCTALQIVNMPSLLNINTSNIAVNNSGHFKGCTSLTTVNMPLLSAIGGISNNSGCGHFYGCTSLTTVTLPRIAAIGASSNSSSGLFYGCKGLTSVQLGSEGYPVVSIGNYTFNQCTQSGLTITIYTTGGASLSGSPWGATNATIVYETA